MSDKSSLLLSIAPASWEPWDAIMIYLSGLGASLPPTFFERVVITSPTVYLFSIMTVCLVLLIITVLH